MIVLGMDNHNVVLSEGHEQLRTIVNILITRSKGNDEFAAQMLKEDGYTYTTAEVSSLVSTWISLLTRRLEIYATPKEIKEAEGQTLTLSNTKKPSVN